MTLAKPRQLIHTELLGRVHYDPATGIFTARGPVAGHPAGKALGSVGKDGYRRIKLDNQRYMANRLAWFYMTGAWPSATVDHEDLQRDNNVWANLRLATFAQQAHNRRPPGGRAAKGATLHKSGRWQAQITHLGKAQYLGLFDTEEEAQKAYARAAEAMRGDFARVRA